MEFQRFDLKYPIWYSVTIGQRDQYSNRANNCVWLAVNKNNNKQNEKLLRWKGPFELKLPGICFKWSNFKNEAK